MSGFLLDAHAHSALVVPFLDPGGPAGIWLHRNNKLSMWMMAHVNDRVWFSTPTIALLGIRLINLSWCNSNNSYPIYAHSYRMILSIGGFTSFWGQCRWLISHIKFQTIYIYTYHKFSLPTNYWERERDNPLIFFCSQFLCVGGDWELPLSLNWWAMQIWERRGFLGGNEWGMSMWKKADNCLLRESISSDHRSCSKLGKICAVLPGRSDTWIFKYNFPVLVVVSLELLSIWSVGLSMYPSSKLLQQMYPNSTQTWWLWYGCWNWPPPPSCLINTLCKLSGTQLQPIQCVGHVYETFLHSSWAFSFAKCSFQLSCFIWTGDGFF